ncbi:hypothetical protein Tcan_14463 [Toxocara canis]|uniref:Uncharacterized protein n=1 Tax=Toxocara canis TaxID=6265 RepID=A0A0B2VKL0_TOXCA|nr:hypothetical protein Tcan_14463 [Toxocara canis]
MIVTTTVLMIATSMTLAAQNPWQRIIFGGADPIYSAWHQLIKSSQLQFPNTERPPWITTGKHHGDYDVASPADINGYKPETVLVDMSTEGSESDYDAQKQQTNSAYRPYGSLKSALSRYHILLLRNRTSAKASATVTPKATAQPLTKEESAISQTKYSTNIPTQWTTIWQTIGTWETTAPPPSRLLCKHRRNEVSSTSKNIGAPFDFETFQRWKTLLLAAKLERNETGEQTEWQNLASSYLLTTIKNVLNKLHTKIAQSTTSNNVNDQLHSTWDDLNSGVLDEQIDRLLEKTQRAVVRYANELKRTDQTIKKNER